MLQLLLFFVIACGTPPLHAANARECEMAYESADFAAARDQFTAALANGESPALRHNLALSEFRLGRGGEAAWQLERALLLDPLNPRYRVKLAALRQELGFFPEGTDWFATGAQTLPLNTWIIIASLCFWVIAAVLILPRASGRRLGFGQKTTASTCALVLLFALPAIWKQHQLRATGVTVAAADASLRSAPAAGAPVAGLARPGERARILDARGRFFSVETESGATGWIEEGDFRPLVSQP